MKRFVDELEKALTICAMCPTGQGVRDYLEEKRQKEEAEKAAIARGETIPEASRRDSMYLDENVAKRLAESVIEAYSYEGEDNRTEQEKEEDSYNEMIKLMLSDGNGISCNYLEKWNCSLDIRREFDFPTDEAEILRILDSISGCYFYECVKLGSLRGAENAMKNKTREVLARFDFYLLERGIDIMPLCEIVDLDLYKREEHIWNCEYSYTLINYYLQKLEKTGVQTLTREGIIANSQELSHAVTEGFIDSSGKLLRSAADFVRFCVKYKYYVPWGRPAFRRINGLLYRADGSPVSAEKLAQAYCDNKDTLKGDDLN